MSSALRESDLRPYQTHFLFSSPKVLDANAVSGLFNSLEELLNLGIDDSAEYAKPEHRRTPRSFGGARIGWLVYCRKVPVTWASSARAPRNEEHHWLALAARGALVSLVVTEGAFATRVHRAVANHLSWAQLSRVPAEKLEAALVRGSAKTLWLSGIHRSVATKADSKVLMGRDLEASLDALGDQTYHYTSTRCEGPHDAFTTSSVGVTPRQSKVWLGPTSHWEAFTANSERLLELLDSKINAAAPYPILARPRNSLIGVSQAFDVGLERAELDLDSSNAQSVRLQELVQSANWSVTATTGANCEIDFGIGSATHKVAIEVKLDGDQVIHEPKLLASSDDDQAKDVLQLCGRRDIVKIYYESAHTYSDGLIFHVMTRDIPFLVKGEDFSGFDVSKEKPLSVKKGGKETLDLKRIGDPNDDSLFTWIYRRYRSGWLWCDDGSGEMADFLHLTSDQGKGKKTLSFIHAKGAHSKSPERQISVSAYEVVCAQALKNLRYLERKDLDASLMHKISIDKIGRCWKDGKPQGVNSPAFQRALAGVKYSDLSHEVVVVQPHVRVSLLKKASAATGNNRPATLLYTLLHGIDADVRRMGAKFEVVVDR